MNNKRKALLVEGSVAKILIRMTAPMVMGMLGVVAFNLADTFFVGQLGIKELAALSFTFPVIMVIHSIALGLGIGTSVAVSKAIGRGDEHKVRRLTTDGLLLSFLFVAFFVTIGFFTITPLFKLLGASSDMISLIKQYMLIWYPGMLFIVVPMVGNNAIRATGDTKIPALLMLGSITLNLILDPLLIFGIGPFPALGLKGAAIATVFSRAITFLVVFLILYFRDKMITFEKLYLKEFLNSWKKILHVGVPVATSSLIVSVGVGVITSLIAVYGPEAVAAFGIGARIDFFAMAIIMALTSVIGPFVGQNWAAGRLDRVRQFIKYSNGFSVFSGLITFILLLFLAKPIASVFTDSPLVISITALYLFIVPISYGVKGVFMLSTAALNVLKKPVQSMGITIVSTFVLLIPFVYLGSYFFGLKGLFIGIVLSYFIIGIVSNFILKRVLNKIERES